MPNLSFHRFFAALIGVSFATVFVEAASPTATDADRILSEMRRASGGPAWDSVRTLHATADVASGGGTKTQEQWEDSTGRYLVSATDKNGTHQAGFDGVTSWREDRDGIAYTLGDVDSALVAANESFRVANAWWFRDRHAATIAFIGTRSEKGRAFEVLNVTPEGGRPFDAWIDRTTHLLARVDEQQAEDRDVTDYADYRSVKGLMIPFSVRTGDGHDASADEVATVRSVDINPDIADSRFSLPAAPPSTIELPPGHDSVDITFVLTANNRILVPVMLDHRITVQAEFDTGGSLLLQPSSVGKIGAASEGHHRQSGGGEGTTTSSVGRLESLEIGDAKISGLSFHSFAFNPDAPDEALIGLEILQRFVVALDFDRNVMTLTRPEKFRYAGNGSIVPFHFQDNQPEVKGSVDGIAGLFAIDTGDNSSLLLIAPFARRYGLVARYAADIPYDGKAIGATRGVWARKRAGSVTLDGMDGRPIIEVRDPVTRISLQQSGFDANRDVSANIGLGILRQFNLTFDYSRRQLIFEPNHFFNQPDIFNRTGFRLKRQDASWVVTTIYSNSPASAAGIVVGDHILRIADRKPDEINEDALSKILKGEIGTKLELEVEHDSSTRSLQIELRDVF